MTTARVRGADLTLPDRVIRLRPTSSVLLGVTSLLGLVAFFWPLLIKAEGTENAAHSTDAPWVFLILLPLLFAIVLAELAEGAFDAKGVALLGVLAACGTALRLPGGIGGFEPLFFLPALSFFLLALSFFLLALPFFLPAGGP